MFCWWVRFGKVVIFDQVSTLRIKFLRAWVCLSRADVPADLFVKHPAINRTLCMLSEISAPWCQSFCSDIRPICLFIEGFLDLRLACLHMSILPSYKLLL